jgi:hypothetical protein
MPIELAQELYRKAFVEIEDVGPANTMDMVGLEKNDSIPALRDDLNGPERPLPSIDRLLSCVRGTVYEFGDEEDNDPDDERLTGSAEMWARSPRAEFAAAPVPGTRWISSIFRSGSWDRRRPKAARRRFRNLRLAGAHLLCRRHGERLRYGSAERR